MNGWSSITVVRDRKKKKAIVGLCSDKSAAPQPCVFVCACVVAEGREFGHGHTFPDACLQNKNKKRGIFLKLLLVYFGDLFLKRC